MTKFYITTAIDYTSGKPHLGHAYEKICADVLVRWHRLKEEDVFFLTGTDEHGQKVENSAKKLGKKPKEFVDELVKHFKELYKKLNISFDRFIRTTDTDHIKKAQEIFKKVYDKGDIYKGNYEGLYCTDCEAFYLEKDLIDNKCPIHKREIEKIKEESYFFKLSKYQEKLIQHFKNDKSFVLPLTKRNEVLNRLEEPLKDLSVSRTSFKWGIPLPIDNKHVIYVWFDALINYISGGEKYWPANVHLIGKDILWFHAVIWPCILYAAGYKLPETVFVHGFINIQGEKLSKARGIVVDPNILIDKYGSDALRYFLVRSIPFGEDGDFSEEALKNRINGELANELGNLVSRTLTIASKFDGKIEGKAEIKLDLKKINKLMEKYELHNVLNEIWAFIKRVNVYINEKEPWKLKGKELGNVLYNLLESIRIISILVSPFIPETSEKINKQLGVEKGLLKDCIFRKFNGKIKKGEHLFNRV